MQLHTSITLPPQHNFFFYFPSLVFQGPRLNKNSKQADALKHHIRNFIFDSVYSRDTLGWVINLPHLASLRLIVNPSITKQQRQFYDSLSKIRVNMPQSRGQEQFLVNVLLLVLQQTVQSAELESLNQGEGKRYIVKITLFIGEVIISH